MSCLKYSIIALFLSFTIVLGFGEVCIGKIPGNPKSTYSKYTIGNYKGCGIFAEYKNIKCCCLGVSNYKSFCYDLEKKEIIDNNIQICRPKFLSILYKATLNKTAKEICFKDNKKYGGLIEGISNNIKELNGCTLNAVITLIIENIKITNDILYQCNPFFPPPPKPASTMENIFRSYGLKPI